MSSTDSEHSPLKPSKRRRIYISDSDSSDGSVVRTHRRRRVYRVSDSETSDDDSDVPKPVMRRKNYRVVSDDETSWDSSSDTDTNGSNDLVISDSDSSGSGSKWRSGEEEVEEGAVGGSVADAETEGENHRSKSSSKNSKKSKSKLQRDEKNGEEKCSLLTDGDTDSSNSQGEKCPICLLSFKKQEIANPESCDHSFCLDCLLEWSKNINTCPIDRQTFTLIIIRKKLNGKVIRQLPVAVRPPVEEQIQEDATFCEICQECDREDRMLLCDGCDLGYHLECLTPPMSEVPMDEWFCPECSQNSQNDAEMIEIDLDELPDLMEEARRLGESYGRTRTGRDREASVGARVIPRTLQMERVRANIRADRNRNQNNSVRVSNENRSESGMIYMDPDQPSTSSSGIDSIVALQTSTSTTNSRSLEIERRRRRARNMESGETASSSIPKTVKRKTLTNKKRKRKIKKRRTTTRKKSSTGNKRSTDGSSDIVVREVRITEINDDGEEEEFVTYVKVRATTKSSTTKRSGRKYKKKRSKNTRKV